MQRPKTQLTGWLIGCSWLCAAAGCGDQGDASQVDYADTAPVGRWAPETEKAEKKAADDAPAQASTAGGAAKSSAVTSASAPVTAPPAATSTQAAQTQSPSKAAAGAPASMSNMASPGSASTGAAGRSSGAGGSSAGNQPATGGSGSTPATGGNETKAPADETNMSSVSSLEFHVTTQPIGGRYQPKNIGAIWVTDDSGKFVKSLEVWARTRKRWLTKYNAAHGTGAADVTASATMTSHKEHMSTWDLKDAMGATVAPGKYKVFAEIADADATGKSVSVDFDTTAGPSSTNPPDSTGFTKMSLQLK
jgi:hypothetical protein